MLSITSHDSFSLITAKVTDNNFILILSNSIGSPVDNRLINIKPVLVTMNKTHAFVTNKHYIYTWQFRSSHTELKSHQYGQDINIDLLKKKMMKEAIFFIEDNPNINEIYNTDSFQAIKVSSDSVTAIFSNDLYLIVACDSGRILRYNLPHISTPDIISIGIKFIQVGISPNGQHLWGIDENNLFTVWDIEKSKSSVAGKRLKVSKLDFEKKDTWSVVWSIDEPFKFALIEKNRLNIIKDLEVEEILTCNGYLAECSQTGVTAVMIEDLMIKPWENTQAVGDIIVKIETRILRDLREMMNNNIEISEIYQYIERNSNRKLWELFSEYALLKLDFINAEKSILHYNDYLGLSFIKRVKNIDDDSLKKAEIYQFFLDYDKAEEIYNLADRKDLIISMRIKLGHWEKVIQLIKDSGYVQEDNMKMAYNNLAMQFYEDKEYDKAEELMKLTNNVEALVNLYFKKEEFDKATTFIEVIPEGSEYLLYLGEKFENVSIKLYLTELKFKQNTFIGTILRNLLNSSTLIHLIFNPNLLLLFLYLKFIL
jgi:WD repeat-containing protein 35